MMGKRERIRCFGCGKTYDVKQLPSSGVCKCGNPLRLKSVSAEPSEMQTLNQEIQIDIDDCFICGLKQVFKDTWDVVTNIQYRACQICGNEKGSKKCSVCGIIFIPRGEEDKCKKCGAHRAATPMEELFGEVSESNPLLQFCPKCKVIVEVDLLDTMPVRCGVCKTIIFEDKSIFEL